MSEPIKCRCTRCKILTININSSQLVDGLFPIWCTTCEKPSVFRAEYIFDSTKPQTIESTIGSEFYNGIEWFACWMLDHAEGETITEEQLRPWAGKSWADHLKQRTKTKEVRVKTIDAAQSGKLEGLKHALEITRNRRSPQKNATYLAALDDIEIFLSAAIGRVESGETMYSTAACQTIEAIKHLPYCDVNDINPDGIVKPCNCDAFVTEEAAHMNQAFEIVAMIDSALEKFGAMEISKLPHQQPYWVNLYNGEMSTGGETLHSALLAAVAEKRNGV
jgi:hypothetical protein